MQHTSTQITQEEWRDIPGYEGLYQVSDHGRVKSVARTITRSNGHPQTVSERIRKVYARASGHLGTSLSKKGKITSRDVHSLVMRAFVGERTEGMEVRHLNGDPRDNRLSNLRYGTRSENVQDSMRHGTAHGQSKTHCPQGHLYGGGNLRVHTNRKGYDVRYCRACMNAYGYAKYHGILDQLDKIADKYYEQYINS